MENNGLYRAAIDAAVSSTDQDESPTNFTDNRFNDGFICPLRAVAKVEYDDPQQNNITRSNTMQCPKRQLS